MRRRDFILAFGGMALWPFAVRAQQRDTPRRIGVLWHAGSAEQEGDYFTALLQGFRDLGYAEGQSVSFVHRFANEQYERFKAQAAELVSLKVDILVAVTRPAAEAAQAATRTIPIVFVVVPDPVANNFADSLARPGGNMTGLANLALDITGKRLQLLKEALPRLRRVAMFVNPTDPIALQRIVNTATEAAGELGVSMQPFEARVPDDIEAAVGTMAKNGMEAIFLSNDAMLFNERQRIAKAAQARRLPVMFTNRLGTQAGGLLSYGQDTRIAFRRVAYYADKIFRGENASDLPIEQPTKFEMLINLKTARTLSIEVPPALIARADEVIE